MRFGGFGLRSSETHASAAFISSFYSCLPLMKKISPSLFKIIGLEDPPFDNNIMSQNELSWDTKLSDGSYLSLPLFIQNSIINFNSHVKSENFFTHSKPIEKTQKELSAFIDDNIYEKLIASCDNDGWNGKLTKVRLLAKKNNKAVAWINVIPNPNINMHIINREYITIVKYWLGLQIYKERTTCPSCKKHNLDIWGQHALVCPTSGDRISRHNAIRDVIYQFCQTAQLAPVLEKSGLSRKTKQRPADIYIPSWNDGMSLALDVAVTSPFTDAVLNKYSSPGDGAAHYHEFKMKEYEKKDIDEDLIYMPMVVESFGSWSFHALEILKKLANRMAPYLDLSYNDTIHQMFQRLSICLVRKNARILNNRKIYSEHII